MSLPKLVFKWKPRQPGHSWNKNSKDFIETFDDPNIKKSIAECKQFLESGLIESSGKKIQNIFINIADLSLSKKKNTQHNSCKLKTNP